MLFYILLHQILLPKAVYMAKRLSYFNLKVEQVIYWLTALSTFIFIFFVLMAVVTRYLIQTPLLSSIEYSRLFFVWACFLSATLALRKNAHIAISFIVDRLPVGWQKGIDFIVQLLIILFFGAILIVSLRVVIVLWHTHFPVSGISQSWLFLPVPVTSLIIMLFSLEKLLNGVNTFPNGAENEFGLKSEL
jgi:TRAP-type transport system small permease protein